MQAQTSFAPVAVDSQTAEQHLQADPNLGIAPIAKLAHVVGDVAIQVKVNRAGRVVGAVALSGPPMLVGTAMDSVRQWTYSPFTENGQPVYATTVVKVSYTEQTPLEKGESRQLQDYYHAQAECMMSERQHEKAAAIAKTCAKFSKAADALPAEQFEWERRKAYTEASNGYLHNNQPDLALAEAEKAVVLVKSGEDDSQSIALAYGARALAEVQLHNLSAAQVDLATAEQAERGAILTIQSETMKKAYTSVLKSLLETQAQVLSSENKAAEAKVKSDEAAKL